MTRGHPKSGLRWSRSKGDLEGSEATGGWPPAELVPTAPDSHRKVNSQTYPSRDDGFEWVLAQCSEKAAAGSGERRLWLERAADKGERHGGI
jgi:hypothetical protein